MSEQNTSASTADQSVELSAQPDQVENEKPMTSKQFNSAWSSREKDLIKRAEKQAEERAMKIVEEKLKALQPKSQEQNLEEKKWQTAYNELSQKLAEMEQRDKEKEVKILESTKREKTNQVLSKLGLNGEHQELTLLVVGSKLQLSPETGELLYVEGEDVLPAEKGLQKFLTETKYGKILSPPSQKPQDLNKKPTTTKSDEKASSMVVKKDEFLQKMSKKYSR